MSWKIYGNQLDADDVDGVDLSQAMRIRMNQNLVLEGLRTWFVFYGAPAFSSLRLKLYDDREGVAGKLIAQSINEWVPADVQTDAYAVKGLWFEFEHRAMRGDTFYHVLPVITGYAPSEASHIAWVKSFPDPEYRTGLDLTYEAMHVRPYRLAVVGAEF